MNGLILVPTREKYSAGHLSETSNHRDTGNIVCENKSLETPQFNHVLSYSKQVENMHNQNQYLYLMVLSRSIFVF